MRARDRFSTPTKVIKIKVTNLSPRLGYGVGVGVSPITPPEAEMQRPPEGGLLRSAEALVSLHSMPGESRLPRARRKPATPRPQTQSAMSAQADDSGDA